MAAGSLLSEQENIELLEHTKVCAECRKTREEFSELVVHGLPLTIHPVREFVDQIKTRTDDGIRARFLRRAKLDGIAFSPDVEKPSRRRGRRFGFASVAAALSVASIVVLAAYAPRLDRRAIVQESAQTGQQIDVLQRQNSALNSTLSRLNQSLAAQQREIQDLRVRLADAAKKTGNLSQTQSESQRSSSQSVPLPAELQSRDKELEQARSEIERINQLRASDEASLVAEQVRLAELSDQLRIARATLDLERQLTAAGKDIRELLTARQLHVIDVRDTDINGKPSKAFGRVFVTEGKSLTFYAFDLNEERAVDAKHRFSVWGSEQVKGSPAHHLGFLYVDDKAQRRWALKVNDPELLREVDSVFVSVDAVGGSKAPTGPAMLFAYLGQQPNHP